MTTFFPTGVIWSHIPTDCDHFDDEPVPTLPDHVDHLSVTHLHHVVLIYLKRDNIQQAVCTHHSQFSRVQSKIHQQLLNNMKI